MMLISGIFIVAGFFNCLLRLVYTQEWTPAQLDVDKIDLDMCTVDKTMTVKYGPLKISCGNSYPLNEIHGNPKVILDRSNVNQLFTLMMIDPDAPDQKIHSQRSWLHWLVVNIKEANVESGFEVVEYNPPTPPKGSGKHRYVFLALKQYEEEIEYLPIDERGKFDINAYAKEHKLTSLSGFTYFQTKDD